MKSGLAGFHDYEIVELLLSLGTPRKDCKQPAKEAISDPEGDGVERYRGRAKRRNKPTDATTIDRPTRRTTHRSNVHHPRKRGAPARRLYRFTPVANSTYLPMHRDGAQNWVGAGRRQRAQRAGGGKPGGEI